MWAKTNYSNPRKNVDLLSYQKYKIKMVTITNKEI